MNDLLNTPDVIPLSEIQNSPEFRIVATNKQTKQIVYVSSDRIVGLLPNGKVRVDIPGYDEDSWDVRVEAFAKLFSERGQEIFTGPSTWVVVDYER